MQNFILKTLKNRIILRDSTETHPFQLERMSNMPHAARLPGRAA